MEMDTGSGFPKITQLAQVPLPILPLPLCEPHLLHVPLLSDGFPATSLTILKPHFPCFHLDPLHPWNAFPPTQNPPAFQGRRMHSFFLHVSWGWAHSQSLASEGRPHPASCLSVCLSASLISLDVT